MSDDFPIDLSICLINTCRWRKMRRASHESFNPRAVEKYLPIQAEAAAHAVSLILAKPDSWEDNLKR